MKFLKNFTTKKHKKLLVTHNGSFHADDIFACATMSLVLEKENKKFEIVRTREEEVIKRGDYVFDVGGSYNPELNRYDHHQKGGAGARENGITYSSFGLAWKHFGLNLCDNNTEVWEIIDKKIAAPIDASDNGIDISTPKFDGVFPYAVEQIFLAHSPTWQENNEDIDSVFKKEVRKALDLIRREIQVAKSDVLGKEIVLKAYQTSKDKKIIFLESSLPRYLIQNILSTLSEPIYFIYPSAHGDFWKVEAVKENLSTFKSRKLFPEAWRGLLNRNPKLKELTGIDDFLFCHSSGFFLTVVSKESAIKLAELALSA